MKKSTASAARGKIPRGRPELNIYNKESLEELGVEWRSAYEYNGNSRREEIVLMAMSQARNQNEKAWVGRGLAKFTMAQGTLNSKYTYLVLI